MLANLNQRQRCERNSAASETALRGRQRCEGCRSRTAPLGIVAGWGACPPQDLLECRVGEHVAALRARARCQQ
eukprot:5599494-Pleurochrysis_carterae.AAC.5